MAKKQTDNAEAPPFSPLLAEVLAEAQNDIANANKALLREEAKRLIRMAADLRDQMKAHEHRFNSHKAKFDKLLADVLARIESMASGKILETISSEATDDEIVVEV